MDFGRNPPFFDGVKCIIIRSDMLEIFVDVLIMRSLNSRECVVALFVICRARSEPLWQLFHVFLYRLVVWGA